MLSTHVYIQPYGTQWGVGGGGNSNTYLFILYSLFARSSDNIFKKKVFNTRFFRLPSYRANVFRQFDIKLSFLKIIFNFSRQILCISVGFMLNFEFDMSRLDQRRS